MRRCRIDRVRAAGGACSAALRGWLLGLALLLLPAGRGLAAEEVARPFQPGERLVFLISWAFIPAAYASLEVAPDTDYGAASHFVMTAHTLPVVDLIYHYRERIDSYVAPGLQHSLVYKKVQESRHPRDIVVRFDPSQGTAQYSNFGEVSDPIPIEPGTLDPLAAFYYIRSRRLDQSSMERWVTDGRELSLGKATMVEREEVFIRGTTYRTIKIEPDLRKVSGVFEKKAGAKMWIWLTDDERKLLVKVQSKVSVGSFVAELVTEDSVIPPLPGPVGGEGH